MENTEHTVSIGEAVRFIDGKFKGFHGNVMKICDTNCSVSVQMDNDRFEIVEEIRYLKNLKAYLDAMNDTEKQVRGQ